MKTKFDRFYLLGVVIVFFVALYFALSGVDFGAQWDQNNIKGFVNKYIRTGNILPGEYHYPPGSSYIATTTIIPYALPFLARYGFNWAPTQRYLLNDVLKNTNQTFLLNLRRVFVFATILSVLWAGLAAAQRDKLAGFVAAAALGLSWELSYQSHIVHPDGPTMQFVALAILFAMLAFYKKRPFNYRIWFGLAAVAAAAATATKYTAGISIFIILILAYATLKNEKSLSPKKIILSLAVILSIFVATFLVLVPGAILESSIFIQQVTRDQEIYATGHGFQTINAGWGYLVGVFLFIFQAAFSHNRILALFFPGLALIGIYALTASDDKADRWLVMALGGIPLLYILFLATHRVLLVRNLLTILPNLAILSGFGFSWLLQRLRAYAPVWRYALVGSILLVLGLNAQWLSYTAWTIQIRDSTDVFAKEALSTIGRHPDQTVYITPVALRLLHGRDLPPNVLLQSSGKEDLILFAYRGDTRDENEGSWPVNFPDASPTIFGPQDMNMDWYANWPGVERLVLSTPALAWQDGARFDPSAAQQPISMMPIQEATGILSIDGEQFFIQVDETHRVYVLNSVNPKVIIALRPFLDAQITFTGIPHDVKRSGDWYLLSVSGKQVLASNQLIDEYNSTRFLSNLTEAQKSCLDQAVGSEQFQSLKDTVIDMIDLSDDQLKEIAVCTE